MKVKHLKFENHPVLGDLDIDFTDEATGEPLDIIAFVGDNGTGKTKILESIVKLIRDEFKIPLIAGTYIDISDEMTTMTIGNTKLVEAVIHGFKNDFGNSTYKAVWLPAELKVSKESTSLNSNILSVEVAKNNWIEYAENWGLDDVKEYIVERINKEIYKDMSKPAKVAFDNESKAVNDVFENLGVGVKMVGLSGDSGLPIFKNQEGKIIELNDFSSGEKQLFFRMLNLKRLNVNDSIIIIDEPETSLHPEWQRKIIEVYKKIGENNQIILATHSPLILGSVPNGSVRKLSRDETGKIQVEVAKHSYGQSVDYNLDIHMGLTDVIAVDIARKFESANQLLKSNQISEAEGIIEELKGLLGTTNKNVMRLEFEKKVRVKQHAKS